VIAFFPNEVVAWGFCALLWAFTAATAYKDTLTAKIPNRWVVPGAILGLAFNILRSALLASDNSPLWILPTGQIGYGIIDGLLFSLVGFLVAFAGMFIFWILGLCGGGDVKLYAAVGVWLGWKYVGYVWLLSVFTLWLWLIARVLARGLEGKRMKAPIETGKGLRLTYSLPIFLATIAVCLMCFKQELGIRGKPTPTAVANSGGGDAPLAATP